MRKRPSLDADLAALRELAAAGVCRAEAARRLGIPNSTIHLLATKFNIPFKSPRRVTTTHDIAALRNLAALGFCMAEAVRRTGVSWTAAHYWAGKLNIRFPDGRALRDDPVTPPRGPDGRWHHEPNPGASGGLSAGIVPPSAAAAANPAAAVTDPRALRPDGLGARVLFAGENTADTSLLGDNHILTSNEPCLGQVGQGLGNV